MESISKRLDKTIFKQVHGRLRSKNIQASIVSIKQKLSNSILHANLEVSVDITNESITMLYKAIIEGINEAIGNDSGGNITPYTDQSGLELNPYAIADRIITISTTLYSNYRLQQPELAEIEAVKSFKKIISAGIESGFAETRNILDGLLVLEGDVEKTIDASDDCIQRGLENFEDILLKARV